MSLMFRSFVLFFIAAFAIASCGDSAEPVSYSAPVKLNLKAKSDDTVQNVVDSEKSINSELGDPFGAFITDAKEKLGNADPSRVELDELSLLLGAGSKGVTALEQVFDGKVDVLFEFDPSKNSYPVAHVENPTGSGPVSMDIDFAFSDLAQQDRSLFYDGSFKVHIRGQAATGFDTKGAEADLQLTLSFKAYE